MKQQSSATTRTHSKNRTIIDFAGKTVCVGIDVHQKDYQVAKVFDDICLGNLRMKADPDSLITQFLSLLLNPAQPFS